MATDSFSTAHRISTVRPGRGRKPVGYVPTQERVDFDEARARNEAAKADLNELELAVRRGLYVERAWVQQLSATALATLAQNLRSVPDNLERRTGISPEVAQEVEQMIDNALNDLAIEFEELAGLAQEVIDAESGGADV